MFVTITYAYHHGLCIDHCICELKKLGDSIRTLLLDLVAAVMSWDNMSHSPANECYRYCSLIFRPQQLETTSFLRVSLHTQYSKTLSLVTLKACGPLPLVAAKHGLIWLQRSFSSSVLLTAFSFRFVTLAFFDGDLSPASVRDHCLFFSFCSLLLFWWWLFTCICHTLKSVSGNTP